MGIDCVLIYDSITPAYFDKTTEANNSTIEDVQPFFDAVGDAFYNGNGTIFNDVETKYSGDGIIGSCVLVYEYSKGGGVWGTLSCTDPANKFTAPPGTYHLTFTPPGDWAQDTVDGKTNYWIRYRVAANAYDSDPLLDQIWAHWPDAKTSSDTGIGTESEKICVTVLEADTGIGTESEKICVTVLGEDAGVGEDEIEKLKKGILMLLKLLQEKEVNIELSQEMKGG